MRWSSSHCRGWSGRLVGKLGRVQASQTEKLDVSGSRGNRHGLDRDVAVEPQPRLVRILRCFYGRDPDDPAAKAAKRPYPVANMAPDVEDEVTPSHKALLVDSTGLKLCGPGEWLVEKHATRTRRSWRKLHIGVDADTGQIIARSDQQRCR